MNLLSVVMSKKKSSPQKFIVKRKESCGFADNRIYALSDTVGAGLIFTMQDVQEYNKINEGDTIELTIIKK